MLYQLCRQPKSPWHTKTYLYVICTWIIFRNCEHHNTYVWSNHWSIYGFYIHTKNTYILALLIHNAAKPPDMSVRRTEGQRWRYQDMATISASLARDSRHRSLAMRRFDTFWVFDMGKLLKITNRKQSSCRWFMTPQRSWDVTAMLWNILFVAINYIHVKQWMLLLIHALTSTAVYLNRRWS